jgi:hypothetical protein
MTDYGANALEEVLARPDPLEVLEKWMNCKDAIFTEDGTTMKVWQIIDLVKELRTNPDAVIARGKEEGWL